MKKRTNSVISSLYHPSIGNSRLKTAACMFGGGVVLVCLGVCLIVTTLSAERTEATSHVDETSVLISGPTCLALGLVVSVLSATDVCRYRRARNSVESQLNRVVANGAASAGAGDDDDRINNNPKVSIVIHKALWPS